MSLWIKYTADDNGLRPGVGEPWPAAAGVWWNSPDIVAIASGGIETQRLRANRKYGVRVRVTNDAAQAAVNVQVWACKLSPNPLVVIRSWDLTGTVPKGTIATPAVAAFDTPPGQEWTAPAQEADAHVCLMANCWVQAAHELVGPPLDVPHIARHGQNNLAYAIFPPWVDAVGPFPLLIAWRGLPRKRSAFSLLELRELPARDVLSQYHAIVRTPWVRRLAAWQHGDDRRASEQQQFLPVEFERVSLRQVHVKVGDDVARPGRPIAVHAEPDEDLRVELAGEAPACAHPGWQAYDVIQRDPDDGEITGGVRVVVLMLPKEIIDADETRTNEPSSRLG